MKNDVYVIDNPYITNNENYGNSQSIDEKIQVAIDLLNNPEYRNIIENQIAGKIVTDEYTTNYLISNINLEQEIESFLAQYTSGHTIKTYRTGIYIFSDYCIANEVTFLKTNVTAAQYYLQFLMRKYNKCSNSIHARIKVMSNFFEFLHLRYPEIIKINPFKKMRLPKIVDKYEKDFVNKNDFDVLCDYLKRIKRKDILCCIKLLYKYGWRIGIIPTLKIKPDCTFIGISKGEKHKGTLTKIEVKDIQETGLLELNFNTVRSKIKKITEKLHRDKLISCSFSAHDLRRTRILIDLQKEGGDKFLKVSQKYHKSINTTQGYISKYYTK